MRKPGDRKHRAATLRQRASRAAKKRYPAGKAFGRIRFFEIQRSLAATKTHNGVVAKGAHARQAYASALAQKAQLAPGFAQSVALPVWQPLGPTHIPKGQTYGSGSGSKPPVSGRCSGVVVDPANSQRITLCSAGGGLWGTLDGGATWRPLSDDAPTLSMGAIAAAPGSPNIVYAGTGEGNSMSPQGMGLLRSADGGLTWTHVPCAALTGHAVYDLAVDPKNALHVFIGTTNGLYESGDGGATCTRRFSGNCWDISIHPKNPKQVYATNEAGLHRSSDGGATWGKVALPGIAASTRYTRMAVCHAPSKGDVVYVAAADAGPVAYLWRKGSANGAFMAETIPVALQDADSLAQAWYDWCLAVAPDHPDLVFWGVIDLYRGTRSASGHWQWTDISSRSTGDSIHPDQHAVTFDPGNPIVVFACCDGGVFRSPDRGGTWKSLNPGLSITEFEFLAQLESDANWIIGGTQDNGTLGNAGQQTWNQVALGDGGACGTDEQDGQCYHSYYGIGLERSDVGGVDTFDWKDVSPTDDENYAALFYPPLAVDGPRVARAGVSVFVSADCGANWNEIELPAHGGRREECSALVFASAKRLYAGTVNGRLFRIDRGADWAQATVKELQPGVGGYISDILADGAKLWVSVSSFGAVHVAHSTDSGASWHDRSGNLPDIPVNALVVDPDDDQRVFAATDHGVYQTRDAGATWMPFSNGLPNAIVGDLVLHETRRLLRAGTRSRGAWEVAI
jgi:photosystem II stability/assembly factor-like uncharacterized protein